MDEEEEEEEEKRVQRGSVAALDTLAAVAGRSGRVCALLRKLVFLEVAEEASVWVFLSSSSSSLSSSPSSSRSDSAGRLALSHPSKRRWDI